LMWPIVKDLAEVAAVAEGEVHALRLCPNLVPSYAGFADGRGVDEGSQFLNMSALWFSHLEDRDSYLDILR
jgi:hypothetical protein